MSGIALDGCGRKVCVRCGEPQDGPQCRVCDYPEPIVFGIEDEDTDDGNESPGDGAEL